MATPKSPFLVIQNFISPKICEEIVDSIAITAADVDDEGDPIKMYRYKEDAEVKVFERLQPMIPGIMEYYNTDYQGTEQIQFEIYPEGTVTEPLCENSNYLNKKWVRTKSRDLTGILFLSEYCDDSYFDSDYEVYGGKLEFAQHNFGFNPQRGTLVIYPSGPHFINATAAIKAGDLYQARIQMVTRLPFLYQPVDFPGDYRTWFKHLK